MFVTSKMRLLLLAMILSFSTDSAASEGGNATQITTVTDEKLSPDIFRQLLNQETIIRLSLTKNVQALMKDMLTMKQSLLSMDADFKDIKKTVDNLRKENDLFKRELPQHEKTFAEINNNLQRVNDSLEKVRKNTEYFENRTTSTLADHKTEIRYTSLTLLNLDKHTKEVEKNMPILMDERLQRISNSVNKTIGNLSMDALKSHLTEEVIKAVDEVKLNFLETQNKQLKLSNSISALEMFRMNVSSIIADIGTPVGFTAAITADHGSWSGTNLIFPKVISNIGRGYNPNTGIFTSPVDGDFVFYVAMVSYSSNSIKVDITVNGNGKVSAWPMNGAYESGSNLLFIRLRKDDIVVVQRTSGSGYESDSVPVITFSGFKI